MSYTNSQSDSGGAVSSMGPLVKLAITATAGVALIMAMLGLLFGGVFAGASVLVGGTLAVGNLIAFALVGHGLLHSRGVARSAWALVGAFKFVILLLAVALLLRYKAVGALPMIIGYGALPVGITLSSWLGKLVRQDQG